MAKRPTKRRARQARKKAPARKARARARLDTMVEDRSAAWVAFGALLRDNEDRARRYEIGPIVSKYAVPS